MPWRRTDAGHPARAVLMPDVMPQRCPLMPITLGIGDRACGRHLMPRPHLHRCGIRAARLRLDVLASSHATQRSL
jgi:hypothetical protein